MTGHIRLMKTSFYKYKDKRTATSERKKKRLTGNGIHNCIHLPPCIGVSIVKPLQVVKIS